MVVAAFDLSLTCSGYAIGVDGRFAARGTIPTQSKSGKRYVDAGVPRVRYIRDHVMDLIENHKAEFVVFEDFAHAAKGNSTQEIGGMSYTIWAECEGDKIPYCRINPATLKKFIAGRGGSPGNPVSKEIVIREVYRRFGIEADDNNEADACGLLFLGMGLVGEWQAQTEVQREVINQVLEKNQKVAIIGKAAAK